MAKKNIKRFKVEEVKANVARLRSERATWEHHWQEVADHIIPRKNTITTKRTDGERRTWQLLDNIGLHSNELLAGALHGLLTNPDLPWFELTTGDLRLDNTDDVRGWLQRTARSMHNVLNNSNFQTEVHELYIDIGSIGTSCMLVEEDPTQVVRFSTKFIADYYIDENRMGFVDHNYYETKMSAASLVHQFGEKALPKKVLEAYKKHDTQTKFCLIHAVYPKSLLEPTGPKQTMQYISQYVLPDEDHEIEFGQFASFPYVIPRWSKAAGEKYGRSPGMNALPELKILNKMNETMLIGAQKMVDPPLQVEDDGVVLPLITRPGGVNFTRPGAQSIRPIFANTNIEFGYQAMQDRRQRVKDAYYVDQLKLQQGGPMMTATEVLQRTEESMRLLGPFLGRMQSEFLRPLIDRVFYIMQSQGLIEPAPKILEGRTIDARYSSMIAKSQRVNEGQSAMRVIQAAAPFIQMDPGVAQNFNGDAIVRILATTYGLPTEGLRTEKEVATMRKAQADAQAQQQAMMQDQADLQNAQTITKTMKEAKGI